MLSLPTAIIDKEGRRIMLREAHIDNQDQLLEMYESFEPKEVAMGLPSRRSEHREDWVNRLLAHDFNLLAVHDGCVIGHAALMEIDPRRLCEYIIFVHQDYQNKGIGTGMTKTVKECAIKLGFKSLWLTVNQLNVKAVKVFRKVGFKFLGTKYIEEEMRLDL